MRRLVIAAVVVVSGLSVAPASAATLTVGHSGASFKSITAALAAAAPGDVIEIVDASKQYLENVVVYRNAAGVRLDNVTIRAAAGIRPVVDGGWDGISPGSPCVPGPAQDGSTIKIFDADGVTIQGLRIIDAAGGSDQANVAIWDGADGVQILDNIIHHGRNEGILFADSCSGGTYSDAVVSDNEVFDFVYDEGDRGATCIRLQNTERARVEDNHVHHCGRGIHALDLNVDGLIQGNRVHDILAEQLDGIPTSHDEGIKLDDGSTGFMINRNLVYNADDNGIRLDDGSNAVITHNTLVNNGHGNPDNIRNQAGIVFQSGGGAASTIYNNIIAGSAGDAILVDGSGMSNVVADANNTFGHPNLHVRDLSGGDAAQFLIGPKHRTEPTGFSPGTGFLPTCESAAIDTGVDFGQEEPRANRYDLGWAEGPDCGDTDEDGFGNWVEEHILGTQPDDPDTDGDLFADGTEYDADTDPNDPTNLPTPVGPVAAPVASPVGHEMPGTDALQPIG